MTETQTYKTFTLSAGQVKELQQAVAVQLSIVRSTQILVSSLEAYDLLHERERTLLNIQAVLVLS